MPWTKKKNRKGQICVHKEGADGKPIGPSLGCHDTEAEANRQLAALYAQEGKSLSEADLATIKCYEMAMSSYVPWSATTLQEALDAEDAREKAEEVWELAQMYKQLVDNILGNSEVKDKGTALVKLAKELAAKLGEQADDDDAETKKSVDHSVIKSLTGDRIGGYAVVWGDEAKRDLTKQYFTTKTAELTAIFDAVGRLPWMYQHAMDGTLKTKVSGVVDTLKPDSIGLWYEAQLKLADDYDQAIKQLIAAGKLKTSSQTLASALEYNEKTGEITRWPIVEITGTPTPAEYRMPPIEMLKTAYAAVGVENFEQVVHLTQRDDSGRQQGAEKARLELALARLQLS